MLKPFKRVKIAEMNNIFYVVINKNRNFYWFENEDGSIRSMKYYTFLGKYIAEIELLANFYYIFYKERKKRFTRKLEEIKWHN